jgi:hypothetical protein
VVVAKNDRGLVGGAFAVVAKKLGFYLETRGS